MCDFTALAGIDWADRQHDICLQAGSDGKREFMVLEHRPEAIEDWANGLRVRFENRPVDVCLEQCKGPLIQALMKYEHLVLFPVNPQLLAGLRRTSAPSGAKDDPSDAELAVDILLQHRGKLCILFTPRPGFAPGKKRQASFGALTPGLSDAEFTSVRWSPLFDFGISR